MAGERPGTLLPQPAPAAERALLLSDPGPKPSRTSGPSDPRAAAHAQSRAFTSSAAVGLRTAVRGNLCDWSLVSGIGLRKGRTDRAQYLKETKTMPTPG